MKHSLCICFLLALLVSGCTQEEMLKNGTSVSGKGRTFTTSFEKIESRTYLEEGRFSRWTEGDRISLFDGNTLNGQYLFAGETGDSGGTFFMLNKLKGTGSSLAANYAVYPYSEDVAMIKEGEISVSLPTEQHYAENSYGLGDNTMVAVTENVDDTFLRFKNVGGAFKFQLYGDDVTVKSIILKGNNGEKIAGKATITADYGGNPVVAMAEDATTAITLDCGEKGVKIGASAEEATAFWMVVPPTTFEKGITILVKDIEGKIFTQTTDKQLVVERNVVKPMSMLEVVTKPDVTNDWSFSYEENYVDSLDAIYCNKGYIAVFGYADVPTIFDGLGNITNSEERILYISKVNEQGDVDETDAIMAVVDSTNFPIRIVGNGINAILSRTNQNYFDILVYDSTIDDWREFKNIDFLNNVTEKSSMTRSLADAGSRDFTFTNVVSACSYLTNIGGVLAKKGIEKLPSFFGLFGDVLGSIGQDELGLGIAVTVGQLPGAIVGVIGYLSLKYDKLKKSLFCDNDQDIRISIESVNQIDKNTVEICYDVQGLNEKGKANSDLFFMLTSWGSLNREIIFLSVENGYKKKVLTNLKPGLYTIDLTLISRIWPLMYTTKPEYEFKIFDLELDRYEFLEEPTYKNGEVTFKMELFLNGDKDYLGDVQQFGYYIRYANVIDYKQVKYLSSIFASTPATYELKIPKEGFLGNTMNYATFEARPNIPYYIGVYVVLKNGKIVTFDEEVIEGLVYDHEPTLKIRDLSVGSTETISEENWDRKITYTFWLEVDGAFWMDEIYKYYVGDWTTPGKNGSYTLGDGGWTWDEWWVKFSSKMEPSSDYSYFGTIVNGKEIQSNRIIYNFNGPSCNITLSDSRATRAPMEDTHNTDMFDHITPSVGMSILVEPEFIYRGEGRKLDENFIED